MQRALFPMTTVNITQTYGIGTHRASFAVDNAGKDGGIEAVFAPFDCVVKKTYTPDANEVWIESCEKVQYADGTEDYMTIMFAHDNNIADLYVGKKIKQGEMFYQEGTKGMATGNHIHMECGKGKFTGSGWFKNSAGYWGILNAKKPEDCLFVKNTATIKNTGGIAWKRTSTNTKPAAKTTYKVGDFVKITGKYAASASGTAKYSGAIGQKRYITKIYKGYKNPYQLGTVKGATAGYLTTGFAPEKSISK